MEVIVGTAGHIDHGKTALVRALTGTDTDRLPEEKKRGITIDLGFAEMRAGDVHFGFVDVPGHERFVKNMLAGASGIDVVLLVVAADEGVMPQTREHFDICRLLGISAGVIALTKTDLVDDETLELARLDVNELVAGSFLDDAPIVSVSSRTRSGVDELREKLSSASAMLPSRRRDLIPQLPVDRSFSIKGFGAVVTGTLASGTVRDGDQLELLPQKRAVRVRGIQTHGQSVDRVMPGQRTAVNLAGIDHTELERGMLLTESGVLEPTQTFDARVEVLKGASRPLRSRQRVRVHVGTSEVLARVAVLADTGEITPGETGFAQLRLEAPVAVIPGERFIIRSYSPQVTIAGGMIADNAPVRHRRGEFPRVTDYLHSVVNNVQRPRELVQIIVQQAGAFGLSVPEIRGRTGLTVEAVSEALNAAEASGEVVNVGTRYLAAAESRLLADRLVARVNEFYEKDKLSAGMTREALRTFVFSNGPIEIFEGLINHHVTKGKLTVEKDIVRPASHRTELTGPEKAAADVITSALKNAALEPPKTDELLATAVLQTSLPMPHARKLLNLLGSRGDVVRVSDEYFFSREAVDKLTSDIRDAVDGTDRLIDVPKFKQVAGVSRKFAIPLLEYFDREHITARRGDKRIVL